MDFFFPLQIKNVKGKGKNGRTGTVSFTAGLIT